MRSNWRLPSTCSKHSAQYVMRDKKAAPLARSRFQFLLEATPGFEPGVKALQASALPLGHVAILASCLIKSWPVSQPAHQRQWSGQRDSNPRPSPWQGGALPTEPCPRRSAVYYGNTDPNASPNFKKFEIASKHDEIVDVSITDFFLLTGLGNLIIYLLAGTQPRTAPYSWAASSGGERFPDTEEVTSSNLVSPTTIKLEVSIEIC